MGVEKCSVTVADVVGFEIVLCEMEWVDGCEWVWVN